MSHPSFDASFAGAADYAAMYRELGLQVVPAKTPKEDTAWKRPALPEWRELENELVPELTFQRWYGPTGMHANRDNMGIITGKCSNIVVVDLDVQKNPEAHLWWLMMREKQQTAGEITTVCQKTGGGGFQHLFKVPDGWVAPTRKTSIGVDIRGQGGFIMCPPSLHESGDRYEWLPDQEPWSHEIAMMPSWLCDEIDLLVEQHGGSTGTHAGQKTASPEQSLTAFGLIQDGREDYMTKFVWGRMIDLYRDAPMISQKDLVIECQFALDLYLSKVKSRLPEDGTSQAARLEKEGRGESMFRKKWAIAAKQWDTKISDEAKKGTSKRPLDVGDLEFDPETGEILNQVFTMPEAPADPNQPVDRFLLIPSDELKDEPVQWLIKDILPVKALGSLYGKPGTYKSFVAMYAASHIALGWPVFGKETVPGDVVYIAGEGGAGLKRRMDALTKRHNLPRVPNLYFLKSQLNLRSKPEDLAGLLGAIKGRNISPQMIVIDTLARSFGGGNENASEDMGAFIAMMGHLQAQTGAAVLLVHHSGKDEARGQRGHSSLLGAVDAELELMKLSEDDSLHRIGQLTITKQKDGEDGLKFLFHMETVALSAIDPEQSSLALVPVNDEDRPAAARKPMIKGYTKDALDALKVAIAEAGKTVGLDQIPQGKRVVSQRVWKEYFDGGQDGEPEAIKKRFLRAHNDLKKFGTIGVWQKMYWISED